MKVVAIIQARLNSTRLPRKCLAEIEGRPLIDHVVERALAIEGVDRVVLNIPLGDRELDRPAMTYQIAGQEKDVLNSFKLIAKEERADVIVRLTGDCPLLCPYLAAQVVALFMRLGDMASFCLNDTNRSGFPDGTDVEVFSRKVLELAAERATGTDREHVTPWMRRVCPSYSIMNYQADLSARKWSVDTAEDLARIRAIFAHLTLGAYSWKHTLSAEDRHHGLA